MRLSTITNESAPVPVRTRALKFVCDDDYSNEDSNDENVYAHAADFNPLV